MNKKPKYRVDNDNWLDYKEEYFTTAVKAASYIKKNKLNTYTIWIYTLRQYLIIMSKNHDQTIIYNGFAIPKVLTDLVRWKGNKKICTENAEENY